MAGIPGYEAGIRPGGTINAQASGQQFGAGVGAGLQQLGGAVENFAQGREQVLASKDAQDIQQLMAKERLKATQDMETWASQANPGDDEAVRTFSNKLMENAGAGFKPRTKAGQDMLQTAKTGLYNDMSQRAAARMAAITAAGAAQDHKVFTDTMGQVLARDPAQLDSVLKSMDDYLDNPSGLMAKVSKPQREAYRTESKRYLAKSTLTAMINGSPTGAADVLGSVAPDKLHLFDPFKHILQGNAASDGKVDLTDKAKVVVPQASAAGAKSGVNPNILLAQVDIENPADPVAAVKQSAAQLNGLLTRYGGDYGRALAAQKLGTGAVDRALMVDGSNWMQSIPQEAANTVESTLAKAGLTPAIQTPPGESAPQQVPSAPTPQQPVSTGMKALDLLPFEDQQAFVQNAMQIMHMRVSMAEAGRREAEYLHTKAQEDRMDSILKRIVDPKKHGNVSEDDILMDPILDYKQKQHAIDYRMARNNELRARSENRTNPTAVRELELRIMAKEGDPKKIYNLDPVMDAYRDGRISTNEMSFLRREVQQLQDGAMGGFMAQVSKAREAAHKAFFGDWTASNVPNGGVRANEAYYGFMMDLDAKIQAKREKNEDPRTLLDPASPDYVMKADRLKSFWPASPQTAMAQEAAKQPTPPPPGGGYVQGKRYNIRMPDGSVKNMLLKGRDASKPESWVN